jgi:Lon protease-like protein
MTSASIPLFPLGTVLFPEGRLPLQVFEVRYLDMVSKCIADEKPFGVVSLTQGSEVRKPGMAESLAGVGTMARIVEWQAPMAGLLAIVCTGTTRFRIASAEQQKHGLWVAQVEPIEDDQKVPVPAELRNTADALAGLIASMQDQGAGPGQMPVAPPYRLEDCAWVANRWCELLPMAIADKQRMLELDNPVVRLELVQDALDERGLLE